MIKKIPSNKSIHEVFHTIIIIIGLLLSLCVFIAGCTAGGGYVGRDGNAAGGTINVDVSPNVEISGTPEIKSK